MLARPSAAPHSPRAGLPARAGIGLKSEHSEELRKGPSSIGFLEVHAENYMGAGGQPHADLTALRALYPLSVHGVGLSIGSEQPLDATHLDRLRRVLERYQPESFSEHLAWSTHDGHYLADLLPVAYNEATLVRVVDHIDQVQTYLGRRMLLENPSTYVAFSASDWDEVDFIAEVQRRSGCGLLLDVNNVAVTCANHGRDPIAYLDAFPVAAVGEIHLAGYAEDCDSLGARLLIDAHGSPVATDVWQLYAHALTRTGPVATLIEWDNNVPALDRLIAEATMAEGYLSAAAQRRDSAA
ncbi:MAG TPA: DUF692 domain-containing protein [Beijerinckiaceae bacterium]|nr:DUF692 domain-containing protein [Beijerinckiaceae bacterium]